MNTTCKALATVQNNLQLDELQRLRTENAELKQERITLQNRLRAFKRVVDFWSDTPSPLNRPVFEELRVFNLG